MDGCCGRCRGGGDGMSVHAHFDDSSPRVLIMPDKTTILSNQPIIEAEKALAEAASHERIDSLRRDFDRAVEEHCMRFGFDESGELL